MEKIALEVIMKYVNESKFTIEKHPLTELYIVGHLSRKPGSQVVWNEQNANLRGLIIDGSGNIIQRSFQKFFTYKQYITMNRILLSEGKTLLLPDEGFRILEKVDGSMSILYWLDDIPYLATQRSFQSPNALRATEILHKKYSGLFSKLARNVTYIFEAIYPETRVLVNYGDSEDLVLLGVLDKNGKELPLPEIGFPTVKDFTKELGSLSTLEDLKNLNFPNQEGLVISYKNGLKIKIKFPWFSEAHELLDKIIDSNSRQFNNKKRLANLMGLTAKRLSNIDVWKSLKHNEHIESILVNVPEEYYSFGFEQWLLNTRKELLEQMALNRHLSAEDMWAEVMPKQELYFDMDANLKDPKTSTPMWRLLDRIENLYL